MAYESAEAELKTAWSIYKSSFQMGKAYFWQVILRGSFQVSSSWTYE